MSRPSVGLARITIAAPQRRVDVALPESSPVAELLPAILRHAGESLADDGQTHGGWVLRRSDGAMVDQNRTLGAQDVLDGEILQLVPRHTEWPELDYDDIVDVIATGARKIAPGWTTTATRHTTLAVAGGAFVVAALLLVLGGGPWRPAAYVSFGAAAVALVVAIALSRIIKDAAAAVPFGVLATILGLLGGLQLTLGERTLPDAGATQWLIGFAVLVLVSTIAYAGVAFRTQWFVAGIFAGLLGLLGAWMSQWAILDVMDAAAIVGSIAVVVTPAFPLLAIRLAKLPVPTLPTTTEELLADPPAEPLPRVHATVQRSDEILTGLFVGTAAAVAVCQLILVLSGNTSAVWLSWLVTVVCLLRARLFPTLRHRVPLLVAGLSGVLANALAALDAGSATHLYLVVPLLVLGSIAVLALGRYLIANRPTPYMGRIADLLDVLLIVVIVPMCALVIGLYGYLRGLFG